MKELNLKPTAKLAIGKNVLKTYNVDGQNTVYLQNNTEFELELYNPLDVRVLCKIDINGAPIGGQGIVLNPGQRVFLERYLVENKKFKYVTYEVDRTSEVEYAIRNNGKIKVSFFREFQPYTYTSITYTSPYIYCYSQGSVGIGTTCPQSLLSIAGNTTLGNTTYNSSVSSSNTSYNFEQKKETGIIDKGSYSSQNFSNTSGSFDFSPVEVVDIKILPQSEKIYEVSDIKHKRYCSNCGSKIKQGNKFCANCGNKI